jgi:phytoene synthase
VRSKVEEPVRAAGALDWDAALAHCEQVALQGKNNLFRAAQYLAAKPRYHLFTATYAAMRVVDDAVDVDFLGKPAEERERQRGSALSGIDRWLRQVEDAAAGTLELGETALEPGIFMVLSRYLPESDLTLEPWRALASSMRHDVLETQLSSWDDFLAYCEGASVAPASVFIYILACRLEGGWRTSLSLPMPPADYARAMALFCYVVHILRDLPKDARRTGQLVTIPRDVLAEAGLTLEPFCRAVRDDDLASIAPVLRVLLGHATRYGDEARATIERLSGFLGRREQRILWVLFHWYRSTFETVRDGYAKVL